MLHEAAEHVTNNPGSLSHGAELAVAFGERMAPVQNAVMQITASACPSVIGYTDRHRPNCALHNNEIARRLAEDPRIGCVVILLNFSAYPKAQRPPDFGKL